MTKRLLPRLAAFAAGLLLSTSLLAAEGGATLQAGNDLSDKASLQRGAKLFMGYCSGCHSLKYLRYSRMAEDLGLTEDQVTANLNFTGAPVGQQVQVAMPHDGATKWFGKMPPDLSLIARVRGPDWVYTYLKSFYLDESRPLGWNNKLFPNASMPNPLWELQGLQHAKFGPEDPQTKEKPVEALELASPGTESPAEFDRTVRDITNFLEYAGEPAALKRQSLGVWVILFLAALTFLAFLLKKEFWKDVH
ncbi:MULTISPECIES: cytochrome c1 [Pseudoxanthomonas]|jgi:ubiquinol-cytochrome c reductase cytochrome c1 subunit|uniref:Cytochrome c1 n=1 Tax=Pseudoxanthomonas winnipegensis TaxID=2480810 RepID=A0A4Q8LFW5_9GAMM|nr:MULTISPECIES: cytochrome c1 [Pseudoxanthomonas]PZP59692.1 MAG: cytochrome c1 [Pseudoxanthomonas spadix]TAA28317.1 cytochrome c1 [Pseudoxanthomonas winnipegensis]TMN24930.1 cytochrome c1 [Pseudoxanthomonas sp. X-1]UAY73709.1 cytochrome c1 [Pseudoxanthomonas sp. X-1]